MSQYNTIGVRNVHYKKVKSSERHQNIIIIMTTIIMITAKKG
jgi:hypothetical protein